MQAHYPFAFEREMGCTAEDLRAWLPGACGQRTLHWREGGVEVALGKGTVSIDWQPLAPRRIALVTLPRLAVRFAARDTDALEWHAFMRRFDLYVQRGGG
ncbi:MAG TPA: hypothetical protein VFQ16_02115 [Burkholderiaceae bacterium]|nr:hypothetical protein [Burkholderiaceae bacterium]